MSAESSKWLASRVQVPSREKRQYYIWSFPPPDFERKSWKAAAAWISSNSLAYKLSRKIYPRNIFLEKTVFPRTKFDRFLKAIDHAIIDAIITKPKDHMVLFGKWLINVSRREVDQIWESLTYDIEAGKVPYAAKISTRRGDPDLLLSLSPRPKGTHLLCVYTPNFLWRADVREARLLLMKSGFQSKLYYKPDVFTILEIQRVAGTCIGRDVFTHLQRFGIRKLEFNHRYFG